MTDDERGFRGFELNAPEAQAFARTVGEFIANFAVIETTAHLWLHALSSGVARLQP